MSFQRVAASPPPPGPVDLDRVEAEAGQFAADGWVARTVPGLVAELRAAREAIDVMREYPDVLELAEAVAAYDQAGEQP